ncbi:hypothetical protein GCHA_2371 [Paraglaciecola chathamensis S18K6]|uniref:Uncharacterized protein n=1 Tax=Paraglaciecola chathamensis S18K6 TaxID=1127672 RepID=A0AAV3UZA0_9ALTE|nr:hypothetical protein GCHA_2371 [Paraglaciecola chathamensis S18K6]
MLFYALRAQGTASLRYALRAPSNRFAHYALRLSQSIAFLIRHPCRTSNSFFNS